VKPWIYLLIGSVVTAVIMLVIAYIYKKNTIQPTLTEDDKTKLLEKEKAQVDKELELEKEKTAKIKALLDAQNVRLEKMKEEFEKAKEKIDENSKVEFEKYLTDTDATGAELDRILGIRTTEVDRSY
jgi:peptidoglycan hydrolase CwlO-like protein